jgi:nucleoside-diphosphate-sugar epimerase
MSKVLVTGMAGFIGSETARQLRDAGATVVGCDNMNDYYDPRLKRHRLEGLSDCEFVELDIENRDGLAKLFSKHKFDAVYNLAARAGVRYSMVNPDVYFTTNVHGTLNLLEQMRQKSCNKMILASTSSLYAGVPLPFNETAPVNTPISPYAASKKAAEVLAYTYHFQYGLDVSVVRYFTVYGPACRPDMSILKFIWSIDQGREFELYGDGEQSRDFTYVTDIAAGTIRAGRKLGYEIINLGGGRTPVTINTMIQWMEEGLGKKAKIKRMPAQKADMQDTQADITKAGKLLEWQPQVDFRSGLTKTLQWYADNREFLSRLKF